jgi:hypothetical protein
MNYLMTLKLSHHVNVFYFPDISNEFSNYVPYIPKALCYGLFGPFLWHCHKIISLFVGLENTFILILFIVFILTNFKKDILKRIDIEVVCIILYVIIMAVTITFASPNWGTLVRYKIGYLPFFLLVVLNNNPLIALLQEKFIFLKTPVSNL